MPAIKETYINALLADAAYAERLLDGDAGLSLVEKLQDRMTPTVAAFIAANFEVAAHKESDDTVGSGFDATVWRGKADRETIGDRDGGQLVAFFDVEGITHAVLDSLAKADVLRYLVRESEVGVRRFDPADAISRYERLLRVPSSMLTPVPGSQASTLDSSEREMETLQAVLSMNAFEASLTRNSTVVVAVGQVDCLGDFDGQENSMLTRTLVSSVVSPGSPAC